MIATIVQHPLVHGAVLGLLGAAVADYDAFRQFHSWLDVKNFGWSVASFRWFQGAVIGGLAAAGYGAIV